MTRTIRTQDGKKVVIDIDNDPCMYEASGQNATRGTDLHAHKAKSGKVFFYFYRWSMWQSENADIDLCSKEEAEEFLIRRSTAGQIGEFEEENAKEYGIDLGEETA